MPKTDPRVDAYIAKTADYAKPILSRIRRAIHSACPDVEETFKWQNPAFMYKGILCITPAFKRHAAMIFWHPEVRAIMKSFRKPNGGIFPLRHMKTVNDLPSDAQIKQAVKETMRLRDAGIAGSNTARTPKPPPKSPPDFAKALKKNTKADAYYKTLAPSHKREYVLWITGAKRPETRLARIEKAVKLLASNKKRTE